MTDRPQINVFVICTMTKRFLGTGNLLLREVAGSTLPERFSGWSSRLQQSRSASLPAIDIYSGGHWSIVRSLNSSFTTTRGQSRLWVVSAGYGLISSSDAIIPYSATFSPGQPDSISSDLADSALGASAEWWRLLSQWRPPCVQPGAPRSVAELVSQCPEAASLLVLSPDYFRALHADLCEALKRMANPQNLIVLSSDDRSPGELAGNTVRVDARLQVHLGGARSSLGIRTAQSVLQELEGKPITVDSFRAAMEKLIARHGVVQVYDRQPQSDEQVLEYISAQLSRGGSFSPTGLLDKFRSSGRQCERKRFQKLYNAVKELRAASLFALNAEAV